MIELGPQGQVSESGDAGAQKGEKRWCEGTKGIHCGDSFRGSVVYLEYGRGWIKKQKKKIDPKMSSGREAYTSNECSNDRKD